MRPTCASRRAGVDGGRQGMDKPGDGAGGQPLAVEALHPRATIVPRPSCPTPWTGLQAKRFGMLCVPKNTPAMTGMAEPWAIRHRPPFSHDSPSTAKAG